MLIQHLLQSGYIRAKRRLADLSPAEAHRARADLERLHNRYPWTRRYDELAAPVVERLQPDHVDYCTRIGHPNHAASVELAAFLVTLCDALVETGEPPRRVVDLGSGFTSFVLRCWAHQQPDGPEVWSVDDSSEWLEKTRGYLVEKGCSTDHLYTWSDFRERAPYDFDIVVHDLGTMDVRARTLSEVIELARPGGLIVLDDVHKPDYRRFAIEELARHELEVISLKAITRDALTRYAYLVEK